MSLLDRLVDEALRARADLSTLRPVVEKELLHHDILREMGDAGFLAGLTFIGGTCLRSCYGSLRLSEDLDFTGGSNFQRSDLATLGDVLTERLLIRYGLPVKVSAPVKTGGKVSTWKLTIETRGNQRDLPAQRIHLDICAIQSHEPQPRMLRNLYGIDLGTSGLILRAQSREEILADKVIAFAFRENRMKNRDLWDIVWLVQQGVELPAYLVPLKIRDYQKTDEEFKRRVDERLTAMRTEAVVRREFVAEMRRFLPANVVRGTVESPAYWEFLSATLSEQIAVAVRALR